MKRLLMIAAVAALGLVAAPAASAQESFTFGDADVLGPVHVRGDMALSSRSVLVRGRHSYMGLGKARRGA